MNLSIQNLLILILILMAACSPARAPFQKDTLVVAIDQAPVNLDPRIGIDKTSDDFHHLLYNGLMRKNEDDRMVPDLASSWKLVNPRLYRFYLKSGVRFHNGKTLTAKDVVFTYQSMLSGSIITAKKASLESIAEIRAVDPHIVEVKLHQPFNGLIYNMNIGIIPVGSGNEFARNPIGTGPYKLISYQADAAAVLQSFENYFEGAPKIRNLKIRIIPDATTRVLEIRKGTVDLLLGPAAVPPDYFKVLRNNPDLKTLTRTGSNYSYVAFNLKDPLLKQREVRLAIAHAIRRDEIIQSLFHGTATPATGLLPPHNWAYEKEVLNISYNPEKAKKILEDAGFRDPDGAGQAMRFWLTLKTSTSEFRRIVATVIQKNLAAIGVGLNIRSYEFGTYFSDVNRGNFQMCMLMWVGESDPDIYSTAFSTTGPRNRGKYTNADVDAWIQEARQSQTENEQIHFYSLIQKKLAEDAPYISLWYEPNLCIMRRELQGMKLTPDSNFRVLKDVYWEEN
ncbi:MAG TPA: ABC transporter substrate-binding protein [Acidobacteriota bacterium]|nr:ABC transporter substrate-binding protein [Acidobacteriota bacterium]